MWGPWTGVSRRSWNALTGGPDRRRPVLLGSNRGGQPHHVPVDNQGCKEDCKPNLLVRSHFQGQVPVRGLGASGCFVGPFFSTWCALLLLLTRKRTHPSTHRDTLHSSTLDHTTARTQQRTRLSKLVRVSCHGRAHIFARPPASTPYPTLPIIGGLMFGAGYAHLYTPGHPRGPRPHSLGGSESVTRATVRLCPCTRVRVCQMDGVPSRAPCDFQTYRLGDGDVTSSHPHTQVLDSGHRLTVGLAEPKAFRPSHGRRHPLPPPDRPPRHSPPNPSPSSSSSKVPLPL